MNNPHVEIDEDKIQFTYTKSGNEPIVTVWYEQRL